MNKTLKKKWVEALRSGKYKQSKGYLQHPKGFCCLGVLCDVIDPNSWGPSQKHLISDQFAKSWRNTSIFSLPTAP